MRGAKRRRAGVERDADEWNYPRAFLASDGNIIGISYNKTWVMDLSNGYRVLKTGEIPLVKSGISKVLEHSNPNSNDHKKDHLKVSSQIYLNSN